MFITLVTDWHKPISGVEPFYPLASMAMLSRFDWSPAFFSACKHSVAIKGRSDQQWSSVAKVEAPGTFE